MPYYDSVMNSSMLQQDDGLVLDALICGCFVTSCLLRLPPPLLLLLLLPGRHGACCDAWRGRSRVPQPGAGP
jgi:hypothetical protein